MKKLRALFIAASLAFSGLFGALAPILPVAPVAASCPSGNGYATFYEFANGTGGHSGLFCLDTPYSWSLTATSKFEDGSLMNDHISGMKFQTNVHRLSWITFYTGANGTGTISRYQKSTNYGVAQGPFQVTPDNMATSMAAGYCQANFVCQPNP